MCLIIGREKRIRVASKDKVVYKRFYKDGEKLTPPYYDTEYRLGRTQTVRSFSGFYGSRVRRFTEFPANLRTVERGLHSYSNPQTALKHKLWGQIVVKCVVPKGTSYINGHDNEVVSLALRPVKIYDDSFAG